MVQNNSIKFYAKVTGPDNYGPAYFKGVYQNSESFKNAIRGYISENIDTITAYNLTFEAVSNVGKIEGLDESTFIEV